MGNVVNITHTTSTFQIISLVLNVGWVDQPSSCFKMRYDVMEPMTTGSAADAGHHVWLNTCTLWLPASVNSADQYMRSPCHLEL